MRMRMRWYLMIRSRRTRLQRAAAGMKLEMPQLRLSNALAPVVVRLSSDSLAPIGHRGPFSLLDPAMSKNLTDKRPTGSRKSTDTVALQGAAQDGARKSGYSLVQVRMSADNPLSCAIASPTPTAPPSPHQKVERKTELLKHDRRPYWWLLLGRDHSQREKKRRRAA